MSFPNKKINLSNIGRIFYGFSITGMGLQTVYYHDFPYMLIPPKHSWIPGFLMLSYISGALLILAGVIIVLKKKTKPVALWLGVVLLLIFCFYHVPYQFIATSNYMQPIAWDNALKELALSGGAFVIAGSFSKKNENSYRLITFGSTLFGITITCFGVLHFLYAKGVAEYISSWMPCRLFWTYLAGAGLLSAGIAIILKIKVRLAASLLGTMIFIWFIILHMPKVIVSPFAEIGSEATSALLALAYSGTAFVVAGLAKKTV